MMLATIHTGDVKGSLILTLFMAICFQLAPMDVPAQSGISPPPSTISPASAGINHLLSWGEFPFAPLLIGTLASPETEVNALVREVATSGNDIYAVGDFQIAGDNLVGYVARWDGAAWHPLGDFPQGLDGPAQALAVDGDNVYVGGTFTQAGPIRTRNIAVWNRTTNMWSDLGGGVGGTLSNGVSAIAVRNGQVFVGGSFIAAGKTVATYIARWDGRRWYRVGTGLNDGVKVLYFEGDYLYAGGNFTIAGDIPARGIARYNLNSGAWENVGVDINGSVNAIAADSRYFYVGGVFDSVAGQRVNNIIRIEKSTGTWSPLYKGLIGYSYASGGSSQVKGVEAIVVRGDQVYVAGTLTQAQVPTSTGEGNLSLAGVALWKNETWSNLDPNLDPDVRFQRMHGFVTGAPAPPNIYSLALYKNDSIVIGGDYSGFVNYSGGQTTSSPYLAILDENGLYHAFGSTSGTRSIENTPTSSISSPIEVNPSLLQSRIYLGNELHDSLSNADGNWPNAFPSIASDPVAEDIYWQPVGPDASTDNGILALASDNSEVYAGGTFVNIFGIEANGIAVRRNKEWFPLDDGTGIGIDGFVFTIVMSGSKVYVGGQFSKAGGVQANNIAVWDRTTRKWSALGSGITGDGSSAAFVSEILLNGNDVYVGGNFSSAGGTDAKNIAVWKNNQWSGLGTGIEGTVNALELYRGNIYAGGSFSRAGGVSSNGVAYWNGTAWNSLHGGVNGSVNDLEVYYSFPGDTNLVIGGKFTIRVDTLVSYYGITDSRGRVVGVREVAYTGNDIGQNIVLWNGSNWRLHEANSDEAGSGCYSSAPVRMKDGEVRKLVADGTDLYVCGSFNDAFPRGSGSVSGSLSNVAVYNRTIFSSFVLPLWSPLQGGTNGNVNALTVTGDEIIIGGDFSRTANGDKEADHVGIWNKKLQEWQWAGNPTALAPVEALAVHNNALYASGSFTSQKIGLFNVTTQLAKLTSGGWRAVAGSVRGTSFVLTSASGGELLSGGAILSSDSKITVNVSRWNATTNTWNPLTPGSGVASLEDVSFVSALAADNNYIFVGGSFDIADTLSVRNIARWNRALETWQPLADGLNGTVNALVLDNDGTLYAGGSFTKSGSLSLNHVARWDGTGWQPVGDGVDGTVYSLAIDNGILYAGGSFNNAGNSPALNIARWEIAAQSWSSMSAGLTSEFKPSVSALSIINGQLFAAGNFDRSGTDSIDNIARWNPSGWWTHLGSGTDRFVKSLAADPAGGALYAGGYFLSAGNKPSRYVGRWTDVTLSVRAEAETGSRRLLQQVMPNPFAGTLAVTLNVPEGKSSPVTLTLFDATGREVRSFVHTSLPSGTQTIPIEGENLTTGVYLLRLQRGEKIESVKVVKGL